MQGIAIYTDPVKEQNKKKIGRITPYFVFVMCDIQEE
jgi:hypothetical protein